MKSADRSLRLQTLTDCQPHLRASQFHWTASTHAEFDAFQHIQVGDASLRCGFKASVIEFRQIAAIGRN